MPSIAPHRWPDYRVGDAIHHLLVALGPARLRELFAALRDEALASGLTYEEHDGSLRPIEIMLRPKVIRPEQHEYFSHACSQILAAQKRLFSLYFSDPDVKALLPFTPEEQKWLYDIRAASRSMHQTLVARFDAATNFGGSRWQDLFCFFESNTVGIGGLFYAPVTQQVVVNSILPALKAVHPQIMLCLNADARLLLLKELRNHAARIGRRLRSVAFVADSLEKGGITEYPRLVEFFGANKVKTFMCDSQEMELRHDEICYGDNVIDLIYRDCELIEIVDRQKRGYKMSALKSGFIRNQVVSTIGGDFDHKSCFEIFTSPRFYKYFTPPQVEVFRRHLLWTRLLSERRTDGPEGKLVDLVEYTVANRLKLVLKPSRGHGGEGIVVGLTTSQTDWEQAIRDALKEPGSYVVQKRGQLLGKKFPIIDGNGELREEEFFVVCGFITVGGEIAILGRANKARVVNVAQHGGMLAVLMGQ